jgi:hypothetical protein
MSWRFFRRIPIIGNLVTVNVSKGGVSVSAGVPGLHVTSGTSGSQATVGLPGTGLFYTHRFQTTATSDQTTPAVANYVSGIQACLKSFPINPAELAAALNRQREFGVSDADFTPDGQATLRALREWLRDSHGYRIALPVQPAVAAAPTRSAASALLLTVLLLVGIVVCVLLVLAIAS